MQKYEGAPVEQLRTAPRKAFIKLIELAIAESVDFVLIAGDLYDGDWKDANTGLFFVEQMTKLNKAGIPVVMISGNHDAASVLTRRLPLPGNVTQLNHEQPQTLQLDSLKVAIHGQSFARRDVSDNLAINYPAPIANYFNIGLLHTSADGREGHDTYAPCSVQNLINLGYDYWALGHIHTREILCQRPFIAFSGNIQGRHIREAGPKGCYLVSVNNSFEIETEFRPLHVLRWERLEIQLPADFEGDTDRREFDHQFNRICTAQLAALMDSPDQEPLAIRIQISGTPDQLQPIRADRENFLNGIRSLALSIGSGQFWIEKLSCNNLPVQRMIPPDDSVIGELKQMFEAIRRNPDLMEEYGFSPKSLLSDLPHDLRAQLSNAVSPTELIDEAEALLLQKLTLNQNS